MTDKKKAILESLKGGLIVSCQVQHDDPVYSEDFVLKMAKAAEWAGAVGIRANSPEQIRINAILSRCALFILAWILNTNAEKSFSFIGSIGP